MKMPYVRNFFREFFWLAVISFMAAEISIDGWGLGLLIALFYLACGVSVDYWASDAWRRLFPPDPDPSVWTPARMPAWWERPIKHEFLAAIGTYIAVMAIIGIISELGR